MVCPRCTETVRNILQSEGLTTHSICLGEASIEEELTDDQTEQLAKKLHEKGFELLYDVRTVLSEQIRIAIQEWVRESGEREKKLSKYLSDKIGKEYSTLGKLFSDTHGCTIEQFAIAHRIEYAKELISYKQLSTSEIAYQLGYSSPAHFSSQFKQVTGITPKAFKESSSKDRTALSDL